MPLLYACSLKTTEKQITCSRWIGNTSESELFILIVNSYTHGAMGWYIMEEESIM